MNSSVEKVRIDLICDRCRKRIRWAWVVKYRSYRLTQFVYVCSRCGNVIKVTDQGKERENLSVREASIVPGELHKRLKFL